MWREEKRPHVELREEREEGGPDLSLGGWIAFLAATPLAACLVVPPLLFSLLCRINDMARLAPLRRSKEPERGEAGGSDGGPSTFPRRGDLSIQMRAPFSPSLDTRMAAEDLQCEKLRRSAVQTLVGLSCVTRTYLLPSALTPEDMSRQTFICGAKGLPRLAPDGYERSRGERGRCAKAMGVREDLVKTFISARRPIKSPIISSLWEDTACVRGKGGPPWGKEVTT